MEHMGGWGASQKKNVLAPVSEQLQVCLSTSVLSCGRVRRIQEKYTGRNGEKMLFKKSKNLGFLVLLKLPHVLE